MRKRHVRSETGGHQKIFHRSTRRFSREKEDFHKLQHLENMNSKHLVFAQFGCGYWGPNLLRNFSALPNCTVKYVADGSPERRAFVEANFPKTKAVESVHEVLRDPEVN